MRKSLPRGDRYYSPGRRNKKMRKTRRRNKKKRKSLPCGSQDYSPGKRKKKMRKYSDVAAGAWSTIQGKEIDPNAPSRKS